jgi:microcystin-dependent protein
MADRAYRQKGMKSLAVIVSMVILASGSGILVGLRDARAETEIEKIYDRLNKLEKLTQDAMKASVPIGTILPYGGKVDEKRSGEPIEVLDGWFFCNGAVMSREKYQELYRVVEAAFGAPTGETFNLPDLRGRFVRGVDHGALRDPDASRRKESQKGGNTGDKVGSAQEDEIKKHSHKYAAPLSWTKKRSNQMMVGMFVTVRQEFDTAQCCGEETRPKNISVNWIIKAR